MDDLCLSIRMFREYYDKNKNIEKWDDDFHALLVETELCVINELIVVLNEQLGDGFRNEVGRNIARSASDALGQGAISRDNHFMYGILDLVQQHTETITDVKLMKLTRPILDTAVQVAKKSRYSYLRCKAFEILATLKPQLGGLPNQLVVDMLDGESGRHAELAQSGLSQWRTISRRVEDMHDLVNGLRGKFKEPAMKVSMEETLVLSTLIFSSNFRTTPGPHPIWETIWIVLLRILRNSRRGLLSVQWRKRLSWIPPS